MKIYEAAGLDVPTFAPARLAKKHGVSVDAIKQQLIKGIEVEQEHTTDKKIAREIALDHIGEDPKYYDKLSKMEKTMNEGSMRSVAINGKLVDVASLDIDGINHNDYPDYSDAFFYDGTFEDGTQLSDSELEQLASDYPELLHELIQDIIY